MAVLPPLPFPFEPQERQHRYTDTLARAGSWSEVYTMESQYPPPPEESGTESSQPPYLSKYNAFPPRLSSDPVKGGGFDPRMPVRRESNLSMRTSFSGQGTGSMSADQGSPASALSEKKKNKLGYHRSSVACKHCRRRKIRCVPSPEDRTKCVNCIRLRKECEFQPVEQAGGPEPFAGTNAHATSAQDAASTSASASASSSPSASASGSYVADAAVAYAFPPAPVPVVQNMIHPSAQAGNPSAYSQTLKGSALHQPYTLGSQPYAAWSSDESMSLPARATNAGQPWQPYPMDPSASNQFPPSYNPTHGPNSAWTSSPIDPSTRDMAWSGFQQPARSMSYSGENLVNQSPNHYMLMQMRQTDQRGGHEEMDVMYPAVTPDGQAGQQPGLHHASSFSGSSQPPPSWPQ